MKLSVHCLSLQFLDSAVMADILLLRYLRQCAWPDIAGPAGPGPGGAQSSLHHHLSQVIRWFVWSSRDRPGVGLSGALLLLLVPLSYLFI